MVSQSIHKVCNELGLGIDGKSHVYLDVSHLPRQVIDAQLRITSYNVCYTKLLRILIGSILDGAFSDKSNLSKVEVALLDESEGISQEVLDALSTASVSIEEDYGIVINNRNNFV